MQKTNHFLMGVVIALFFLSMFDGWEISKLQTRADKQESRHATLAMKLAVLELRVKDLDQNPDPQIVRHDEMIRDLSRIIAVHVKEKP